MTLYHLLQLFMETPKNFVLYLYCNGMLCYLYSGVQICISAFNWGTTTMLHDLLWRRILLKLLSALAIRTIPSQLRQDGSIVSHLRKQMSHFGCVLLQVCQVI